MSGVGRRPAAPAWLLALTCLAAPAAACAASGAFEIDPVAAGIFVHPGKPLALDAKGHDDIANIGFIVGSRCVAVIDTGGSVRIGRALRAAIRQRTALPVCYVINTHVHVDHVLGNLAFRSAGTQFVGSARLPDALVRNRDFFLRNYAGDLEAPAAAAEIIGPDRTVPVGADLDLDLGGRHLTLHAWPTAHTDCDLTVLDGQTRTLWTGDLLFIGRTPALDGSLKGWLEVLDSLSRLKVDHVVPGHGGVTNDLAGAIVPERRYLRSLLKTVRAEIARGEPLADAIRQSDPAERSHWLLWDETHPHNVARAYQELEWE